MANIRPEVLAFVQAARALMSLDAQGNNLPLSEGEAEEIVEYMAKLEQMLLDANLSRSIDDLLTSNGHGHPQSDGSLR